MEVLFIVAVIVRSNAKVATSSRSLERIFIAIYSADGSFRLRVEGVQGVRALAPVVEKVSSRSMSPFYTKQVTN